MPGKKKNNAGKKNYDFAYENLAVPEIHTHELEEEKAEENAGTPKHKPVVFYDSVAIPEVHIKKE